MKKLSTLLIAISFCILSAGNVLANNPQVNRIDRHAVWTNWFDENGNRLPSTIEKMKSERESSQFAYTEKGGNRGMKSKTKIFDFIQETKYYDHAKDKDSST